VGEIRIGERAYRVTSATLDLYHLYSQRPGWDLEVELEGARVAITGTGARPALPGPSPLEVAYIDAPSGLLVERSELVLEEIGQGKVRVRGTLFATRGVALAFDLEAALVT
jgi:hypothetical protein